MRGGWWQRWSGRRVSGLVEMYLAQEPAAFHVDLLAAITAMMQVYLGLRCWPREKNLMMGEVQSLPSAGLHPALQDR